MATKAQLAQARIDAAAQAAKRTASTKPAPRARTQAKVQEHVEAVQPEAVHADIESMINDMRLPSATRVIVGAILGLAAGGAVGYGVGTLMAYALAGIATLTGSALMAFALSALVWVLGIYAGWKLSGWIGGKVFSSVVLPEGLAARCYDSLAGAVSGTKAAVVDSWNETRTAQRIDAFTGAFTKSVQQ